MPTTATTESIEILRRRVELFLAQYLPSTEQEPRELHRAMHYAVLAGGKRIRPLLMHAASQFAARQNTSEPSGLERGMAAVEILHTYSLIHDDLPCMDDDDLRRGQPTVHKKFGDAIAVLAGDSLHVIAFQLMAQTGSLAAVAELADAVGTAGMIGGQVADLQAEGSQLTRDQITGIHAMKTGALIRASVVIGGLLSDAPPGAIQTLRDFGERIGLAFQIVDDILDVEGDEDILGKPVGSDLKNGKATYPGVVGLATAKSDARTLIEEAIRDLELYDAPHARPHLLVDLARFVGERAY